MEEFKPNSVLIRKDYVDVYDCVEYVRVRGDEMKLASSVVIVGQPGIGESYNVYMGSSTDTHPRTA